MSFADCFWPSAWYMSDHLMMCALIAVSPVVVLLFLFNRKQ